MGSSNEPGLKNSGEESKQLSLFEKQEARMPLDEVEESLERLIEKRALEDPDAFAVALAKSLDTFHICPPVDISRYLKRANIADSAAKALAFDWNNVFADLSVSFLREVSKIER